MVCSKKGDRRVETYPSKKKSPSRGELGGGVPHSRLGSRRGVGVRSGERSNEVGEMAGGPDP